MIQNSVFVKHYILFVLLFPFLGFSQQNCIVKDALTKEGIPFAKVYPDNANPLLTDIDGKFTLSENVKSITIKAYGFEDTLINVSSFEPVFYLRSSTQNIEEVEVIAGVNPAHRIVKNAIFNKRFNDPLKNDAFYYQNYTKFHFGAEPEALQKALDSVPKTDTLARRELESFDKQHLFITESVAERTFFPPSKDKENIISYKTSGFENPMFTLFAKQLQSFSFYENEFSLMDKSYINPIAPGGTRRYFFVLEDTLVKNNDSTFVIFYRPKKGKNFDGLTGRLYINTNKWAIEKVTAAPFESSDIFNLKIIQEYEFIANTKWFPTKLSTSITLGGMIVSKVNVEGVGHSYISKISFDPEKVKGARTVQLEVENDAFDKTEILTDARIDSISEKEETTYRVIDSLSKEANLETNMNRFSSLLEGKLPLGYLNLDLARIVNFNVYEGYRLGAGLETSNKFSKHVVIGGYFGWATRDKEWKYGGFSEFKLYPKRDLKLKLRYEQDITERGGYEFTKAGLNLNSTSSYRRFYTENMDRIRLGELALGGYLFQNVKVNLSAAYKRISFTDDYAFISFTENLFLTSTEFDVAETSAEVVWNIREKVMILPNKRMSLGTKWPKISLKYTKGWKNWFESNYDYHRINLDITQSFNIRAIGKLTLKNNWATTIGQVPLTLLHSPTATGGNWNLSVINSFETMRSGEFFADQQVNLFTRLTFLQWSTEIKVFQPQLSLHGAAGFGRLSHQLNHINFPTQTYDKGYYEAGLVLDHIVSLNLFGFGLGAFYRIGEYQLPENRDNVTVKLSLKLSL